MSIKLSSSAFAEGQPIPVKYSGDGEDVSPQIEWGPLPKETRELALIVDDPDAPTAQPFVHWVIYRISAKAPALPEHVSTDPKPRDPLGALQGRNDFHKTGYGGPAPPKGHGTHHYRFHLYALDKPLDVQPGLDKQALIAAMGGHILDEGEVVGTYER